MSVVPAAPGTKAAMGGRPILAWNEGCPIIADEAFSESVTIPAEPGWRGVRYANPEVDEEWWALDYHVIAWRIITRHHKDYSGDNWFDSVIAVPVMVNHDRLHQCILVMPDGRVIDHESEEHASFMHWEHEAKAEFLKHRKFVAECEERRKHEKSDD